MAELTSPILVINVFAALSLLSTLLNSAFAIFVLFQNPTGRVNRLWSLSIACLVVWGAGEFLMRVTHDPFTAFLVNSVSGLGYTMLPSFFLHFAMEFSGFVPRKTSLWKGVIYGPGILASIPQLMGDITVPIHLFYGYTPTPSIGYIPFICWLEIYFVWALWLCYKKLRSPKRRRERNQALFLMIGVIIPLLLGSVTDALLPLLGFQTIRMANVASTITAAFVTYAVMKFQLMSITPATTASFIIDAIQDMLVVTDVDGSPLFTNRTFREVVLGGQAQRAEAHLKDCFDGGEEFLNAVRDNPMRPAIIIERKCRRWDGDPFDASVSISAILDHGETIGYVFLIRDTTEQKKLESTLLRSQRFDSLGTLAGGIAHDLNNILGPILLSIGTLRKDVPEERRQKTVDIIESSAHRGAALVKQILAFSRGSKDEVKNVSLNGLIAASMEIMKETFPKSIQLHSGVPREPVVVRGDETKLNQVLLNLTVNARDAMEHGGKLTLTLDTLETDKSFVRMNPEAHIGRYAVITVSDTGTGISPEIIDRIFDPFFTTKDVGKGTGIGLSTAVMIVKSHEGFVRVYSEPGKGSTFRVYLPLSAGEPQVKDSATPDPQGDGECVLVIEDELPIQSITKAVLESHGYRTLVANDGYDGIEIFTRQKDDISVVLVDSTMPRMGGLEAIREMRKIRPDVRVILQSGLPVTEPGDASTQPDAFLPKPFTEQQLLQTVHSVMIGGKSG